MRLTTCARRRAVCHGMVTKRLRDPTGPHHAGDAMQRGQIGERIGGEEHEIGTMERFGTHGVPVIDYPASDLEAEPFRIGSR